jgi:hypothetical protein
MNDQHNNGVTGIDLEFATTEQLVKELFNRPTFLGVLVYSNDAHKFQGQDHNNCVVATTCCLENALKLLKNAEEEVAKKLMEEQQ